MMAHSIPDDLYFGFMGIARGRVGQMAEISLWSVLKYTFSKACWTTFQFSPLKRHISAPTGRI